MVERAVVTNFSGFTNDDTHAMVNEYTSSDSCAWMNLNTSKKACDMRAKSSQPIKTMIPYPVRKAVNNQRMHARISGEYFPLSTRSRVTFKHNDNIFFNLLEHLRTAFGFIAD